MDFSSFSAFFGGVVKKLMITVRRAETKKAGTSSQIIFLRKET